MEFGIPHTQLPPPTWELPFTTAQTSGMGRGEGRVCAGEAGAGAAMPRGPRARAGYYHSIFTLCSGHCSACYGRAAVKILMSGVWQTFKVCWDLGTVEPALLTHRLTWVLFAM